MNAPNPDHPIGRVQIMSTGLQPDEKSLSAFGMAVADALKDLATQIYRSQEEQKGLRSDFNELTKTIEALTEQLKRSEKH